MTRVDFYILPQQDLVARLDFTCRLIEKAVNQSNNVMVMVENEAMGKQLDEFLWSFKPESFIPHPSPNSSSEETAKSPVAIAYGPPADSHDQVMINLSNSVPQQFSRFKRLIEIVSQETAILEATRQNYKFYQSRGYPIHHHKI